MQGLWSCLRIPAHKNHTSCPSKLFSQKTQRDQSPSEPEVQSKEGHMSTHKQSSLMTTGLALFSMFFGAGNLIFPLLVGQSVGENGWYAVLGLGLTAVVVPFLGLAAMLLFEGNTRRFFGKIGKVPGVALFFLLQLMIGPFGVIPRLVTLMHAMAKPYLSDLSLTSFSLLTGVVIFFACKNRQKLIGYLGIVFTPILLLSLAALIYLGISSGTQFNPTALGAQDSFFKGLIGGYQTMDLIAAFLFATVVMPHFRHRHETQEGVQIKKVFLSSAIAASLLLLSYIGLCFISVYHGWSLLASCPPEELLRAIAVQLLGPVGGFIAVIAVISACLSTAMTLAAIFADYLRADICKGRLSSNASLIITMAVTTVMANLGFRGIAAVLGPILQVIYPGLILLTVLNLLHLFYKKRKEQELLWM